MYYIFIFKIIMFKNFPCKRVEEGDSTFKGCRIRSEGGSVTLMFSPIQYNRLDEPVGGGGNRVTTKASCLICKNKAVSYQTELEIEKKIEPNWTLTDGRI
jgi:hypothetical protein